MTYDTMEQAQKLLNEIRVAQSALNHIADDDGNPLKIKDSHAELLTRFLGEYRNVSTPKYKEALAETALRAMILKVKEDIENLTQLFEEL